MFEPTLMGNQKFIAAFLFKNKLSCLILNFGDHYQEFFRVRSIWCFKKVWLNEPGFIFEDSTILLEMYENFSLVWLMSSRPFEHHEKISFCFGEFQANSMFL